MITSKKAALLACVGCSATSPALVGPPTSTFSTTPTAMLDGEITLAVQGDGLATSITWSAGPQGQLAPRQKLPWTNSFHASNLATVRAALTVRAVQLDADRIVGGEPLTCHILRDGTKLDTMVGAGEVSCSAEVAAEGQ